MDKRDLIACWGVAALLFLTGCRVQAVPALVEVTREAGYAPSDAAGAGEFASRAPVPGATSDTDIRRLIIRNASLDLVVADTQTAMEEITRLVDELGGYIVESNVDRYQGGLRAHLTLRIPAEKLDLALERFRALATEVRSERITGQDVTQEYQDLQAYLHNREAVQARLLEYLEKAETTEDALAVDQQLRQIEAEIEQTKGRIQYLEKSAALSQVTLTLTPNELAQPIQVGGWHPKGTLRNAFLSLIRVMQFLVDAAIFIVVLILPTVIAIAAPFAGLFFLIRFLVRRRRSRKAGHVG